MQHNVQELGFIEILLFFFSAVCSIKKMRVIISNCCVGRDGNQMFPVIGDISRLLTQFTLCRFQRIFCISRFPSPAPVSLSVRALNPAGWKFCRDLSDSLPELPHTDIVAFGICRDNHHIVSPAVAVKGAEFGSIRKAVHGFPKINPFILYNMFPADFLPFQFVSVLFQFVSFLFVHCFLPFL